MKKLKKLRIHDIDPKKKEISFFYNRQLYKEKLKPDNRLYLETAYQDIINSQLIEMGLPVENDINFDFDILEILKQRIETENIIIYCEIEEKFKQLVSINITDLEFSEKKQHSTSKFELTPLKDIVKKEVAKFNLRYKNEDGSINIAHCEYGRMHIIAGQTGAGKSHTSIFNSQVLLKGNEFDKVIYIAKELGNSKLKERFEKALKNEDPHEGFIVVNDAIYLQEKSLIKLVDDVEKKFPGERILYVLDNGTNFALDKDDTSKTGMGMLANTLHTMMLASENSSLLWLTQLSKESLKELFDVDKKSGLVKFKITLGDIKTSSVLAELADVVIGLATRFNEDLNTKEYYNKVLKNGGKD